MTRYKITYKRPYRDKPTEAFISGLVPAKEFAEMLNEKGWLISFKQVKIGGQAKERDLTYLFGI